jgi:hypothetical protein
MYHSKWWFNTSGLHSSLQVKCRVVTWSVRPALWVTSSEHFRDQSLTAHLKWYMSHFIFRVYEYSLSLGLKIGRKVNKKHMVCKCVVPMGMSSWRDIGIASNDDQIWSSLPSSKAKRGSLVLKTLSIWASYGIFIGKLMRYRELCIDA